MYLPTGVSVAKYRATVFAPANWRRWKCIPVFRRAKTANARRPCFIASRAFPRRGEFRLEKERKEKTGRANSSSMMPRFKRLRSHVSSVPFFFFNENVSNASIDDLENQVGYFVRFYILFFVWRDEA